jgi:hypothetical protein
MRNLLTLSAAASVLAIAVSAHNAAALSPGANSTSTEGLVLQVQKSDEKGPGARDGGGKSGDPGARGQDGGGKAAGDPGGAQDKGQVRSGDKAARREGAKTQQRTNVDVDVRGRGGDRDRADRRTRVDIDVDRRRRGLRADRRTTVDVDVDRRRRARGRDVDINVRGYGYTPVGCQDLLRRYRQCIAR